LSQWLRDVIADHRILSTAGFSIAHEQHAGHCCIDAFFPSVVGVSEIRLDSVSRKPSASRSCP
jgi:hypothetical protein